MAMLGRRVGRMGRCGGVVDRLVVDLNPDGMASVATWLDGDDFSDTGPAFEVAWPLSGDALDDLRWYLEDYLRLPSAVYGEKGQRLQAQLAEWGAQVFGAVFGTGLARDAYVRMRSRPAGTRLVFRSAQSSRGRG
jgi:hypothetical protein